MRATKRVPHTFAFGLPGAEIAEFFRHSKEGTINWARLDARDAMARQSRNAFALAIHEPGFHCFWCSISPDFLERQPQFDEFIQPWQGGGKNHCGVLGR